jgi:tRNA threonylcarbamoyladenosine biosynthesis protein TsaB
VRPNEPRLLLLETSGRAGWAALAEGGRLCGLRPLDEARRHARDLAPAVAELLRVAGWPPRDLHAVVVDRGPGSYTGLRVGLMSAKTLAYATGCTLLLLDAFAIVAEQAPSDVNRLDVVADAQQDKIYLQPFVRTVEGWRSAAPLAVRPFAEWLADRRTDAWVSGPGLRKWADRLPAEVPRLTAERWEPLPESMLRLALLRWRGGESDDVLSAEPLYLRPSSAEEQWTARGRQGLTPPSADR